MARREIVGSKEQRMRVIKIFFCGGVVFVQNLDTSVEHYPPKMSIFFKFFFLGGERNLQVAVSERPQTLVVKVHSCFEWSRTSSSSVYSDGSSPGFNNRPTYSYFSVKRKVPIRNKNMQVPHQKNHHDFFWFISARR